MLLQTNVFRKNTCNCFHQQSKSHIMRRNKVGGDERGSTGVTDNEAEGCESPVLPYDVAVFAGRGTFGC